MARLLPFPGRAGEPAGKLDAFEGVRGLASVAVLLGHLVIGFWPVLYNPGHPLMADYPRAVVWLAEGPTRVAIDGQFAVALFFLLSGFVLSVGWFRNPAPGALPSAAARRYVRLMVPAAASVALAYLIMKRGWMFNQWAAAHMTATLNTPHQWLTYFYNFRPTAVSAAREAVWDPFFAGGSRYNQNLWTMGVELPGSFLVYAFVGLFGGLRGRAAYYLGVGAVLALTARMFMLDFLLGVALADLYVLNARLARPVRLPGWVGLALAAGAVYLVAVKPAGRYDFLRAPVLKREVYETAAGFALIGATAFTPALQRVLGCRPLVFLGKISFGLYLIHLVVICSLSCYVYLKVRTDYGLSHHAAAGWAAGAGVTASVAGAWLLYRLVDRPAIRLAAGLYDRWFRPAEPPSATLLRFPRRRAA